MAKDELERLVVYLEGNFQKLLTDVDAAVAEAEQRLAKLGSKGGDNLKEIGKQGKLSALALGAITGVVTAATTALINMAVKGVQALVDLSKAAIGMRSEFEQARIVFTNMFEGDEQAADAFLAQLKEQAALLKISTGEAQRFAKAILPDTSSLEQFNELLRLAAVGAKDAGLPLEELIFSFNEAMSGDFTSIRDRLDIPRDVIQRIKEADDTTAALTEELNKLFTKRGVNDVGAFADTLDTAISSLKTFAQDLLFIAGLPGFESLKEAAQRLLGVLEENRPEFEAIALAVGEVAAAAIDFVSTNFIDVLDNLDATATQAVLDNIAGAIDAGQSFLDVLGGISGIFGSIYDIVVKTSFVLPALGFSGDFMKDLELTADRLERALITATQLASLARAEAARAKAEADEAARLVGADRIVPSMRQGIIGNLSDDQQAQVRAAGDAAATAEIMKGVQALDEYSKSQEERRKRSEEATQATDKDTAALARINDILRANAEAAKQADEEAGKLMDKFGGELLDLQAKTNEEIQQAAQEHGEELVKIEQEATQARLKAAQDLQADLTKLETETAEKRTEIISDAKEDLKKLDRETDKKLSQEQDDFDRQELRQTQDHLREMRRARLDYLDNLGQAVTSRDARAIVDLQARFRREQQERRSDFELRQSREREDQNLDLAEIRQQEEARAAEIIAQREKELANLAANEAKKRTQLKLDYAQELADISEKEQAKLTAENEAHAQRQAELESALTTRLKAIAKGLGDEKEVNEKGAARILKGLSEYFGVGGLVDELMDDFMNRRQQKLTIQLGFEPADESPLITSLKGSSAGNTAGGGNTSIPMHSFQHGGSMIARKPTLALFGEVPEFAQFTPLDQIRPPQAGQETTVIHEVKFSGSAPPGIGTSERDQIAAVIVNAFRESGVAIKPGSR